MKNSILTLFLICIFAATSFSQNCSPSTAQIDLSANSVQARLRVGGDLWWDGNDGKYIVPKGGQTSALFAGSLWMGGIDSGGNLHLAGQTYGSSTGTNDYWAGPLDDNGNTTLLDCDKWDRFFEVIYADIYAHKLDFAADNDIDGPIPQSILGWPGHGNPHFLSVNGFDLPSSSYLAPFYDEDNDGIYDPQQGDYPLVQGDQAIWWVYNDNGNIHSETQALPLKMELQATAFSYEAGPVPVVELTTFYEYKLIYKGQETLQDFYISIWVDPDLGCWSDDYIGCMPEENMGFVYNADNNDENCSGIIGYGTDIPVLGIKLLQHNVPGSQEEAQMSKFMYYFNGASGQPTVLLDPSNGLEFYNYMKGIWLDGTPLSEGGNGYNPNAAPTDFGYPGNPADAGAWTECTANSSPGDRRFLMSFGPYTLVPGAITNLSFAVIWIPSQTHPCPDITELVTAGNDVKAFYEEQKEAIATNAAEVFDQNKIRVSPNPATSEVMLEIIGENVRMQSIDIFNTNGQLIHQTSEINRASYAFKRQDYPAGIYFYKVVLDSGKLSTGKILFE